LLKKSSLAELSGEHPFLDMERMSLRHRSALFFLISDSESCDRREVRVFSLGERLAIASSNIALQVLCWDCVMLFRAQPFYQNNR